MDCKLLRNQNLACPTVKYVIALVANILLQTIYLVFSQFSRRVEVMYSTVAQYQTVMYIYQKKFLSNQILNIYIVMSWGHFVDKSYTYGQRTQHYDVGYWCNRISCLTLTIEHLSSLAVWLYVVLSKFVIFIRILPKTRQSHYNPISHILLCIIFSY